MSHWIFSLKIKFTILKAIKLIYGHYKEYGKYGKVQRRKLTSSVIATPKDNYN